MQIIKYIQAICNELDENKEKLNQLDAAIGDGDHGTNICRGFHAILDSKSSFTNSSTWAADLMTCATVLMSKVGGSSGPLYGTAFLQMSTSLKGQNQFNNSTLGSALAAGLKGIKTLGKSTEGEKTMIDALSPAVNAVKSAKDSEPIAFDKAYEAAYKGAESTIQMKATKGRASYLGERSIGHMDPGALSTALIFKGLSKAYNG